MHNLDPAISRLQEHAARLAMAVGAVRFLGDATTVENETTVDTAVQVMTKLDGELNSTLTALVDVSTQLVGLTEEPLEIRADADEVHVYPSPDRAGLEVDLGEVCVSVPAGRAVDRLVECLTELREHVRVPETVAASAATVPGAP